MKIQSCIDFILIEDLLVWQLGVSMQGQQVVDGYAPFCKHLFVPNFTKATVNALPITDDNRHLLQSAYSKRRPDELAVLTR